MPTASNPATARLIELTEDEFINQFRPITNLFDEHASFDFGEGGCLFAAVGPEWDFVRTQPKRRIWTVTESDGHLEISDGRHSVNRLGYIVTQRPCSLGVFVTVPLR